ncbi:hypothetical protein Tco_1163240 [Tanacetum coccineum]
MYAKMKSIKDNQVWSLIDLHPVTGPLGANGSSRGRHDGNVHTFKAHHVAKGDTQTYGVDYKETLSLIADIEAIRILIAIATYYDYEIWNRCQNRLLEWSPKRRCLYGATKGRFKMENSKRGSIQMQERPNLSKTQGASTLEENILKYLMNTNDMFIVFGVDLEREIKVTCYTDARFKTEKDDRKSQTGYIFVLNGGAVNQKSAKKSTTTMSSTEYEYIDISASKAAMEAIWIRKFNSGLGVVPTNEEPMEMYCDNIGAIIIANEPGVQRDENLADHFMKPLPCTKHARSIELRHANSLM